MLQYRHCKRKINQLVFDLTITQYFIIIAIVHFNGLKKEEQFLKNGSTINFTNKLVFKDVKMC